MARESSQMEEFTIDELASRAKMTVRNVRAYAGRGLIGAPRLEGRTGYYSLDHLKSLQLIRTLLDSGYTLAAVERAIGNNPPGTAGHALDLLAVLQQPGREEAPEVITRDALAALAGTHRDDSLIKAMADIGLLESIDASQVRLVRPTVVRAGVAAAAMGLAPQTVIGLLPLIEESLGNVADAFVAKVRDEIWQPFAAAGMPAEDWPRILHVVETLLPVASQAVLGVFREQIARAIEGALGAELAAFGDDT